MKGGQSHRGRVNDPSQYKCRMTQWIPITNEFTQKRTWLCLMQKKRGLALNGDPEVPRILRKVIPWANEQGKKGKGTLHHYTSGKISAGADPTITLMSSRGREQQEESLMGRGVFRPVSEDSWWSIHRNREMEEAAKALREKNRGGKSGHPFRYGVCYLVDIGRPSSTERLSPRARFITIVQGRE